MLTRAHQMFEPSHVVSVNLTRRTMTELPHLYAMARHIAVDCPLLKIPRHVLEQVGRLEDGNIPSRNCCIVAATVCRAALPPLSTQQEGVLMTHLLRGMQPSLRWRRVLRRGMRVIAKHGPAYNFLHLRLEQDWLQHCATPNMAGHTNCVVKVNNLHMQLQVCCCTMQCFHDVQHRSTVSTHRCRCTWHPSGSSWITTSRWAC